MKVLEMRLVHHKVARPPLEHGHDVGGDVHPHAGLGFNRGRPDVGRAVKMLHLEQRMFRVNRLLFKHIKGRRGENTALKRFKDGLLVDDSPTSAVDDVASAGAPSLPMWGMEASRWAFTRWWVSSVRLQ